MCPNEIRKLTRLETARCVNRRTSYSAGMSKYDMTYGDKL